MATRTTDGIAVGTITDHAQEKPVHGREKACPAVPPLGAVPIETPRPTVSSSSAMTTASPHDILSHTKVALSQPQSPRQDLPVGARHRASMPPSYIIGAIVACILALFVYENHLQNDHVRGKEKLQLQIQRDREAEEHVQETRVLLRREEALAEPARQAKQNAMAIVKSGKPDMTVLDRLETKKALNLCAGVRITRRVPEK